MQIELSSAMVKNMERVHSVVTAGGSFDDVLGHAGTVERVRRGHSDEDLAVAIESGYAVLAAVDRGVLDNNSAAFGGGEYNAIVWACGLTRDEQSGNVQTIVLLMPDSKQYVSVECDRFLAAWLPVGGWIADISG